LKSGNDPTLPLVLVSIKPYWISTAIYKLSNKKLIIYLIKSVDKIIFIHFRVALMRLFLFMEGMNMDKMVTIKEKLPFQGA
jgi:hypothetical protein